MRQQGVSLLPLRKELGEKVGARPEGLRASVISVRWPAFRENFFPNPVRRFYPILRDFTRSDPLFRIA